MDIVFEAGTPETFKPFKVTFNIETKEDAVLFHDHIAIKSGIKGFGDAAYEAYGGEIGESLTLRNVQRK